MPTYISLINYTDQGIRGIKESPKRADAARKLLQDLGGELKAIYLTLGSYDIVGIAEAPSDEVIAKWILALGSGGNIRSNTLKAFPEEDYRKIVSEIS